MAKGIAELVEDFKVLHPRAYARIYNQALEDMSKKIKEYSGDHYLDCDGYFGGHAELVFRTEEFLDDVLSELTK